MTPETLKLLASTKSKITKSENDENVPPLEISAVVLTYCNIADNIHQQNSRVLYTFIPNKQFGQLLDISPKKIIFSKTFNSELSYIGMWFADQNSNPLDIDERINVTFLINCSIKYKTYITYTVQLTQEIEYLAMDMGVCLLLEIWVKIWVKNLSSKYIQKHLGHAKPSPTDALTTASKIVIENKAETTGDLIGNETTEKITRFPKPLPQNNSVTNEDEIFKERLYIYRKKTKHYSWFKINKII